MVDGGVVLITTYLAQATAAALFAGILTALHRAYRQRFLRTWSASTWAFCAYLVGLAAIAFLSRRGNEPSWAFLAAEAVLLIGGFWQLAWLLFGTHSVVLRRSAPLAMERSVIALLAIGSVVLIVAGRVLQPGDPVAAPLATRDLCAAAAFVYAGVRIWSLEPYAAGAPLPRGIGQRTVAVAFFLYGAQQLQIAISIGWSIWHPGASSSSTALLPVDFLLQALIGVGGIVWLLEAERLQVALAAERIEQLAYRDALTGLPNRNALLQHLDAALAGSRRRQARLVVLFLDLDRFTPINDALGYGCGDDVLKLVTERLRLHLKDAETLARVGGDEFAALLTNTRSEEEIS